MGLGALASGQLAAVVSRLRPPKPVLLALGAVTGLLAFSLAGNSIPSAVPFLQPLICVPATVLAFACARIRWPSRQLAASLSPYAFAALMVAFPIQQLVIAVEGRSKIRSSIFIVSFALAAFVRLPIRQLGPNWR